MRDIDSARHDMLETVSIVEGTERVSIELGISRVLASDIVSTIDVPPEDNSAMDGYALSVESVTQSPTVLNISQRIPAGTSPMSLAPGTAARIFTGATIPENANAVVMQENCEAQSDGYVSILKTPTVGENIRPRGQDLKKNDTVLAQGRALQPQDIGLLASIGIRDITVKRKLRVSVVSTGSELVEPGTPLQPGQIYNSNQYILEQLLSQLNCDVVFSGKIKDNLEATKDVLLDCSSQSDIIISSGGVSVGEEDYVKEAVTTLGELNLWKIKMKPGKPLAFGRVKDAVFLGLPGNPVSSFVTFVLFANPIIKKMQGQNVVEPLTLSLPADFSITKPQRRPEFIRVRIENQRLLKFPNQSSGVLTSVVWANALALVPEETIVKPGDMLDVYPLKALL